MINLGPVPDLSIKQIIPDESSPYAGSLDTGKERLHLNGSLFSSSTARLDNFCCGTHNSKGEQKANTPPGFGVPGAP
jgi:hypothetical protein